MDLSPVAASGIVKDPKLWELFTQCNQTFRTALIISVPGIAVPRYHCNNLAGAQAATNRVGKGQGNVIKVLSIGNRTDPTQRVMYIWIVRHLIIAEIIVQVTIVMKNCYLRILPALSEIPFKHCFHIRFPIFLIYIPSYFPA